MATPQINAIETEYAGHRFRSRLEARWAVFFDKLGIRWLYEPQGYTVPNGAKYLPDFWLPDSQLWVEVKGAITPPAPGEHPVWITLSAATQADGLPAWYETGQRWSDLDGITEDHLRHLTQPRILILGDIPRANGDTWLHPYLLLVCGQPHVQLAALKAEQGRLGLFPVLLPFTALSPPMEFIPHGCSGSRVVPFVGIADAYDAARKARFEHGESGFMKPALRDVDKLLGEQPDTSGAPA